MSSHQMKRVIRSPAKAAAMAAPAHAQLSPDDQPEFVPYEVAFLTPARWYVTPSERARSASLSLPGAWRDAARSVAALTIMPSLGCRMQEAASTRSPSISTMQARQFPSAR